MNALSPAAMRAKRLIDAQWLNGPAYDLATQAVEALESAGMLMSPEMAAEFERLQVRIAVMEADIAALTAQNKVLHQPKAPWVSREESYSSPLHHDYRVGHDLPELGGAR